VSSQEPGPLLDADGAGAQTAGAEPSSEKLEELYRAFYLTLVRRATWRYGLSREDAAEVVHDAFVLAITKVDFGRNPKAWIYTVVDRLAANSRRKFDRRARLISKWSSCSKGGWIRRPDSIDEGDE
jgi:DNA-directed RNA polymerase specialized sigma24 family protein